VALESAGATVLSAPYSAQLTLGGGDGDGADAAASAPRFGGEVLVGVSKAGGAKCGRCWNYSTLVGAHAGHPALCERCAPVVEALGAAGAPASQVPAGAPQ
jgi:isoleucyl-tRNA synthetase